MADEKISDLSDGGAPQDTDELVIARAGSNFSLLFSAIKAAIPGGVSSVFSRTGAVTAQSGDYTAAQVGALPSTETLDQIATANATAASVAMNSHKLTGLAAGTTNGDSVRYEQIPTALPPNGTAGGDLSGTYPNPAVKAITETSGPTDLTIGTITDGQFLKRSGSTLVSAAAGTGTVTNVTSANDSIAVANGTTTPALTVGTVDKLFTNNAPGANLAMNSKKLTGLAAGSGAGDSLRYEQVLGSNVLAVSNLVAGTAGQVLGGTGPSYALPPGYEIGYDQITANVTVSSATESSGTTIISCAAHTFDGGAVMVEGFFNIENGTNTSVTICLFESSTQITRLCEWIPPTTGGLGLNLTPLYRFTPTAASHTYTVTAFKTSVNNGAIVAGSGGTGGEPPCFIRFVKV